MPSIVQASAAESTLTCFQAEIPDDGVTPANIQGIVLDANGTPVEGIDAAHVVLTSSRGASDTITALDTRTNASGRMRWTVTSVTAGSPVFTMTVAGMAVTETATTTVGAGPADPGAVFEGSWSNATGSTEAALKDGAVWGSLGCGGTAADVMTVIAGGGVGWSRTANVLRCEFNGGGPCAMLEQSDAVPLSTTHYGQFWIRNDSVGTKNDHPVAYNNLHFSGDIQAVPFTRHANNTNGAVDGQWVTSVIINGSKCFSPPLENETWYRFEWQMEYVTATTVRIHPRIYNDAGDLLYTAEDLLYPPGGYANLQAAYDGGVVHTLTDAELARDWGMGQEGPGGQPDTGDFFYYATIRLGTADWFNGSIGGLT